MINNGLLRRACIHRDIQQRDGTPEAHSASEQRCLWKGQATRAEMYTNCAATWNLIAKFDVQENALTLILPNDSRAVVDPIILRHGGGQSLRFTGVVAIRRCCCCCCCY